MKERLSASVSGLSLTSSRQEKVAVALGQHLLDRLGDQVEGRAALSRLAWPRLTPASPVSSAPVRPRIDGIAGHDLDQGRCGFELGGGFADLLGRQEQQAVVGEEFAGTERLHRFKVLGVALEFLGQRIGGGAGEFRRRRLDHGQDQFVAVEGLLELDVALAPVEVGRNQRVDVGVDREMPRRVVARADRKQRARKDRRKGEARTSLNNRDDNICQHRFFLSSGSLPETPAV